MGEDSAVFCSLALSADAHSGELDAAASAAAMPATPVAEEDDADNGAAAAAAVCAGEADWLGVAAVTAGEP